ncbi:MAG: class I SAM-dependent methyltransferase [Candidatus Omnitrophica bacterium]|nr:class I SAM-dependent methyltransferase [Candidatus Omnitrophota bacterium]
MGKFITCMETDNYQFKKDRFSSHSLILRELKSSGEGKSLLDVGCGRGYLAAILTQRGYKVTGVDNSLESLDFARKVCSRVIHADLEKWDADVAGKFDYILFADVLEHLRDPLEVLRRILPLLKDNGTVLLSVPNIAHFYVRLSLLLGRWDYAKRGILDKTHLRFFTRSSLLGLIKEAGIRPKKIYQAYIPWSLAMESAPAYLRQAAAVCESTAGSIFPGLFAYQWIVLGTKGGLDGQNPGKS